MEMRRTTVAAEAVPQVDQVLATLSTEYQPVIRPAIAAQAAVLGVDPAELVSPPQTMRRVGGRQQILRAELLVRGEELFAVLVQDANPRARRVRDENGAMRIETVNDGHVITLYAVGPNARSAGLAELQGALEQKLGTQFEEFYFESERFEELRKEGRESAALPTQEELAGATLLADREARTLATAIKSAGGLLQGGTYRQLQSSDTGHVDAVLEKLRDGGLIRAEYVVICSKTSTQVMRVPSETLLKKLDAQGVRCTCGRMLTEEGCEAAWSVTDAGQALIDKSAWMTLLLIDELLRIGVPIEDIFVDQQAGGDELDCIALISGDMVLFELKDKPFNLGNAYSFGAKIGIMRPRLSIVVTTEHVGGDAREHFERARQADDRRSRLYYDEDEEDRELAPRYVEGIGDLREALEGIVTEVTVGDARRVLGPILSQASLNAVSLLKSWPQSSV